MSAAKNKQRLVKVELDEELIGATNADVEHEREVAIYDLLEQNSFAPIGEYQRSLRAVSENRWQPPGLRHPPRGRQAGGRAPVSLSPLRRIVKDYYMICDSYYQAIRTATPDKIEALDMGRRGVHNEGSRILMERLKEKVSLDMDTARRLFTLICVLHWKG